jgi:hypothetical protein
MTISDLDKVILYYYDMLKTHTNTFTELNNGDKFNKFLKYLTVSTKGRGKGLIKINTQLNTTVSEKNDILIHAMALRNKRFEVNGQIVNVGDKFLKYLLEREAKNGLMMSYGSIVKMLPFDVFNAFIGETKEEKAKFEKLVYGEQPLLLTAPELSLISAQSALMLSSAQDFKKNLFKIDDYMYHTKSLQGVFPTNGESLLIPHYFFTVEAGQVQAKQVRFVNYLKDWLSDDIIEKIKTDIIPKSNYYELMNLKLYQLEDGRFMNSGVRSGWFYDCGLICQN